jgi:hypothetical protein
MPRKRLNVKHPEGRLRRRPRKRPNVRLVGKEEDSKRSIDAR